MTLTGMPSVAPGDTITSAGWNVITANISQLDGRTGGDPGTSGKILISSGTLAAAWTALTSLINNITTSGIMTALGFVAGASGFTGAGPVTGTTGTFSSTVTGGAWAGGSTLAGALNALVVNAGTSGVASAGPMTMTTVHASGTITADQTVTAGAYAGGSTAAGVIGLKQLLVGTDGVTTTGDVGAVAGAFSGALSALSAAITNAITAATLTLTGLCKAQTFESTVATGTAPFVVASTTAVANLKASAATLADSSTAIADGAVSTTAKLANLVVTAAKIANATITDTQVAAANKDGATGTASMRTIGTGALQAAAGNHGHTGMALIDSGSYAGGGGSGVTKTSSVIGTIKYVCLVGTNGSAEIVYHITSTTAGQNVRVAGTGATIAINASALVTRLNGSSGFLVDAGEGSDAVGYTYNWVAWG